MAAEIIRPNSDITTTWSAFGTPVYSRFNEAVTQPTAGGQTTYAGKKDSNGSEQQCGFPTPVNSGTCTQVKIWMYARSVQDAMFLSTRIQVNGVWTSTQFAVSSTNDVWEWLSLTYTVNNAMSTLGLKIGMQANGMVKNDEINIDVLYAELTYTPAASGGGPNRMFATSGARAVSAMQKPSLLVPLGFPVT